MMDDRTPEQILLNVADEAKTAFNAELFFEWRADHEDHDFPGFMKRYLYWLQAAEPYARSYERIARESPMSPCSYSAIKMP